jgi:hypothetical protein
MTKKTTNPIPDDLEDLFDEPPEPRDLSSEWFERLERSSPSDDELTCWLDSLEAQHNRKKDRGPMISLDLDRQSLDQTVD